MNVHGAAESAATTSAPAQREAPTNTRTVLVVDDQALVAGAVERMVRRLGYEATSVTDPRVALDLLADGADVHVLLSDVLMPGMTGPELVAATAAVRPDVTAVLMSGYAPAQVFDGGLPRGLCFLAKPFELADLAAVLEACLTTSGVA